MTSGAPIEAVWTGEVFQPVSAYWVRRADKQYARGEVLRLIDNPERSTASHQHFFAVVTETWRNLPPLLADRFPSPDHLRKYALIKAGFCNSQSMPCGTAAAARRLASFIRPLDEFAVVHIEGSVVTVFTAKSQSYKTMDRATFKESKERVLDVLAEMIGVAKQELSDNAGKAA